MKILVISLLNNILVKVLKGNLPIPSLFFPRPIAHIRHHEYKERKSRNKSENNNPHIKELVNPKDKNTNKIHHKTNVKNQQRQPLIYQEHTQLRKRYHHHY